jgi:hypothetical protein
MRPLLRKNKKTKIDHCGQYKVKIHIPCYEDSSSTVVLTQIQFCTVRDHVHTCKFYSIHCCLWRSLKYGGGLQFWGYVGTSAKPLCVEFCNFGHVILLYIVDLVIIKSHITVYNWYHNSTILKAQFHFAFFNNVVLNIKDITRRAKNNWGYIYTCI